MPQRRERVRIIWLPQWEGPIHKWACSFIHRNNWRCDHIHDFDDLLQDAYLTYLKIVKRYPRVIEPAHFMALFKTAMIYQMHDKARYVKAKNVRHADVLDFDLLCNKLIGDENAGYLSITVNNAPVQLRHALSVFENTPEALRRAPRNTPKKYRENLNMKLSRILGMNPYDFVGKLKELLA